jgi:hypothetical protein
MTEFWDAGLVLVILLGSSGSACMSDRFCRNVTGAAR